jgi:hypothetical protein
VVALAHTLLEQLVRPWRPISGSLEGLIVFGSTPGQYWEVAGFENSDLEPEREGPFGNQISEE